MHCTTQRALVTYQQTYHVHQQAMYMYGLSVSAAGCPMFTFTACGVAEEASCHDKQLDLSSAWVNHHCPRLKRLRSQMVKQHAEPPMVSETFLSRPQHTVPVVPGSVAMQDCQAVPGPCRGELLANRSLRRWLGRETGVKSFVYAQCVGSSSWPIR